MPVHGHGGQLWLRRDVPEPTVLSTSVLHPKSNGLLLKDQAYWSGDRVTLTCARGLPVAIYEDESLPACPDGYAIYAGSPWPFNPHTLHLHEDSSRFYAADDRGFYTTAEDVGQLASADFFIYRDQLDRVSFYTTQSAALRGRKDERIKLCIADFGSIIVAPYGSEDYHDALLVCSQELQSTTFSDTPSDHEAVLGALCAAAPVYQAPGSNGDEQQEENDGGAPSGEGLWVLQSHLSNWDLNLTASEIDTTAVGEKFGDAVKSLVTGGGTVDFLIAREDRSEPNGKQAVDSTSLMRLLLMTEKGCKADCQFWMIEDQRDSMHLLPGDLFYETKLLVTSAAINTRASEIIAGTINFVTVGRVALKMGTN